MVSTLLAKWSHRRSQNVIWCDSGNDLSFDSSKSFSESMAVYNYLDSWEYIWLQWNLVQNLNISIISPTEMTYDINHKIYFNAMLSNTRHIFLRINALPWMPSPRLIFAPSTWRRLCGKTDKILKCLSLIYQLYFDQNDITNFLGVKTVMH